MDNFYQSCPAKMCDGRFLTDYRSSNTREQYIKYVNGIVRTDDYRSFLTDNTEKILDTEWTQMSNKNACKATTCVFELPTRAPLGASEKELKMYNNIQNGKITPKDANYPSCKPYPDYRLTATEGAEY